MGDVMIGRLVNAKVSMLGYQYPWGNILSVLKSEGVNVINLETTLTHSKNRVSKVFNFKATPDHVKVLIDAKIQIANIANNHIGDFGIEGMEETIQVLNQSGILHTGAGKNIHEAKAPVVVTCNGIKIGIIGCTDNEPSWEANHHPGTFFVEVGDVAKLKSEIETLRSEVDIIIVSYHWGPNMVEEPNEQQIQFAHQLIDLGVDIIHGHSAHVFQGVEIYKEKVILYDTGDFIDDYAVDPELHNDRSFLFEFVIEGKKIKTLKLIPVIIQNMQVNFAINHDKRSAIARMQYLSSKFGTKVHDNGEVRLY
jgi:poly-gamma-glutamate synthesis protein (capsule biosynthesis protein)